MCAVLADGAIYEYVVPNMESPEIDEVRDAEERLRAAMLTNDAELLDYVEIIGRGKALTKASAPFIAIPEINPRSIRPIRTGPRPTLMTWPPMPHRIVLLPFLERCKAASKSRRFSAAKKLGSESRNPAKEVFEAAGFAKSAMLTLLLREESGYVRTSPSARGAVE